MAELVKLAEGMETHLRDIHQDLRDFIALQKEMRMDDKSIECLWELPVIDPQDDIKTIEWKKDKLFNEAYKWIFRRKEYAAFTNWDEPDSPRLLWIKGLAGTGKTMLLIGVIRELESQLSLLALSLSYFFCQGIGDQNLAKATYQDLIHGGASDLRVTENEGQVQGEGKNYTTGIIDRGCIK